METNNLLQKSAVTKLQLRKKMLEIAGDIMTAFISDIAFDFEEIDDMKNDDEIFWVVRKTGTNTFKTLTNLYTDLHLIPVLHVYKIKRTADLIYTIEEIEYDKSLLSDKQ